MNVAYAAAPEVNIASMCNFSEHECMAGLSKVSEVFSDRLLSIGKHFSIPTTRRKILEIWNESFREIADNNLVENWDGYGAAPVSEQTLKETYKFISLLPSSVPIPEEISADADGDILIEWYKDTAHLFTLTISANKTISYAGLFGPYSKVHGTEYFDYKIPQSILENIRKIG